MKLVYKSIFCVVIVLFVGCVKTQAYDTMTIDTVVSKAQGYADALKKSKLTFAQLDKEERKLVSRMFDMPVSTSTERKAFTEAGAKVWGYDLNFKSGSGDEYANFLAGIYYHAWAYKQAYDTFIPILQTSTIDDNRITAEQLAFMAKDYDAFVSQYPAHVGINNGSLASLSLRSTIHSGDKITLEEVKSAYNREKDQKETYPVYVYLYFKALGYNLVNLQPEDFKAILGDSDLIKLIKKLRTDKYKYINTNTLKGSILSSLGLVNDAFAAYASAAKAYPSAETYYYYAQGNLLKCDFSNFEKNVQRAMLLGVSKELVKTIPDVSKKQKEHMQKTCENKDNYLYTVKYIEKQFK